MTILVARKKKTNESPGTEAILSFTAHHLWLRVEDDRAQIGLSDYGQSELGEIIAVELPDVGESLDRGVVFGELESVQTVHELTAPLSGTVMAVNAELDDHPELVNEDPYQEGWLIEVQLKDPSELEDLLPADEYEDSL
jgi:glycine cleavage system H protein